MEPQPGQKTVKAFFEVSNDSNPPSSPLLKSPLKVIGNTKLHVRKTAPHPSWRQPGEENEDVNAENVEGGGEKSEAVKETQVESGSSKEAEVKQEVKVSETGSRGFPFQGGFSREGLTF